MLRHRMKATAIIGIACLTATAVGLAQTTPANARLDQPVTPQTIQMAAQSVVFQTEMVQRIFGLDVTLGGPMTKAVREGKPWQLVNPLAPPEFGDGFKNVTIDPETGRATGINILEIRF